MSHTFFKDPEEVLDYKFDWAPLTNERPDGISDWLRDGETIVSATVVGEAGITVNSSVIADAETSVVAWVSGGVAGTRYKITCNIVTTSNRTGERSVYITVLQR